MAGLYLEDLYVGLRYETGSVTLTEAEMLTFARQYDPQPFHTDPEFAAAGHFGGIIASGFHTLVAAFRLFFDMRIWPESIIASPGMNNLKWLAPVRPGDTLRMVYTFTEVKRSRSKPDRGVCNTFHEVFNQRDELVMTMDCLHMVMARDPVPDAPQATPGT